MSIERAWQSCLQHKKRERKRLSCFASPIRRSFEAHHASRQSARSRYQRIRQIASGIGHLQQTRSQEQMPRAGKSKAEAHAAKTPSARSSKRRNELGRPHSQYNGRKAQGSDLAPYHEKAKTKAESLRRRSRATKSRTRTRHTAAAKTSMSMPTGDGAFKLRQREKSEKMRNVRNGW